jgi:putative hemolysin
MDQRPLQIADATRAPVITAIAGMATGALLQRGRYRVRLADGPEDIARAQQLRWLAFVGKRQASAPQTGLDADIFDDQCYHLLIEDIATGQLVAYFRTMIFSNGSEIGDSYSAQFYDLTSLREFDGPMLEMGRFCIHPAWHDPDILRVAWGALTHLVDTHKIEMLFGCSSFTGTHWETYRDALATLTARHIAPRHWLPKIKAPKVLRFARMLAGHQPDRKSAALTMPPLLKTYLMMGGWVSDHAVLDHDLDTLHVFTGLEIRTIPEGRARALRMIAG